MELSQVVLGVALLWTSCLAKPVAQQSEAANTIDITGETVKHVESLILKDPNLPRLTRGEIVSLIQEVRNISEARGDKSLLVVLPVNNATGHQETPIEDFYTKEAVTRYVGEPPSTTTSRPKRRRKKPTQPRPVYQHSPSDEAAQAEVGGSSTTISPSQIYLTTSGPQESTDHLNHHHQSSRPYTEDIKLPGPMRETLVEISISPTEAPQVFVTPERVPRPTVPPIPSDVKDTAANLSPDIKQVLNSIGLLGGTTTTEKPSFLFKAVAPSIDPSTYSRFKPLPTNSEVSDDMKPFLKSFGLLEPPNRQMKSMKLAVNEDVHGDPFINEDILTDDMKSILKNIGLMDRKAKKVHVFNPQEESAKLNQTEHMLKINKILKKLREVSEGGNENISSEELKELLALDGGDEVKKTLLDSAFDPSLLNAEDYQSLETIKNEVKRQQPNITSEASASASSESGSASASASASSSASDSSSASASASASSSEDLLTTAAPEEETSADSVSQASEVTEPSADSSSDATERTPSLDELADSFGGTEISTRRPNGFYFLLDWNSFLDVGLEERKINLNFSPKVGDPKNFLPVTFP